MIFLNNILHLNIVKYNSIILWYSCIQFGFETRIKNFIHICFGNLWKSFWLCICVDGGGFWDGVAGALLWSLWFHLGTAVYRFFKVIYRNYSNFFTINRCQQPPFYTGL